MQTSRYRHQLNTSLQQVLLIIKRLVSGELEHLLTIHQSRRPWHMPIIAAIAISFPVFVGAYFGALPSGIKASMGAMVILNTPFVGRLPYRLVTVMAWGFAMSLCFALGLIAQQIPVIRLPVFIVVAFGIVVLGRYYRQSPPAGLFVMMACAIALFMPVLPMDVLPAIALVMLGSGFAMFMALLYSLFLLASHRPILPAPEYIYASDTISESIMVTSFVSLALLIALMLKMPNPYWAAVSCFIIIQGIHLRTMWIKQFHRLLGTVIGIVLAGWMLSWGLSIWGVALAILVLMLCIESLVDRHYGMAVIFITPLTIFIAEYGSGLALTPQDYQAVIHTRLWDSVIGCLVALSGGVVMHSKRLHAPLQQLEKWLLIKFQ